MHRGRQAGLQVTEHGTFTRSTWTPRPALSSRSYKFQTRIDTYNGGTPQLLLGQHTVQHSITQGSRGREERRSRARLERGSRGRWRGGRVGGCRGDAKLESGSQGREERRSRAKLERGSRVKR